MKAGNVEWARKTLHDLTDICNIYKSQTRRQSRGVGSRGQGEEGNGQVLVNRHRWTERSLQSHAFSLSTVTLNKVGQRGHWKKTQLVRNLKYQVPFILLEYSTLRVWRSPECEAGHSSWLWSLIFIATLNCNLYWKDYSPVRPNVLGLVSRVAFSEGTDLATVTSEGGNHVWESRL